MKRGRMFVIGVVLALGLLVLLTACGSTALSNRMSYQGRLTDGSGNPINGSKNLTFRLYTTNSGGTAIWQEIHNGVQVNNGLFEVVLGSSQPLDEANFHQQLFLEVVVDGQVVSPRQQLLAAPYAFSLVPGAVIKGYIGSTDTYSSTLNVANFSTGQAVAAYSLGGTALGGISASTSAGYGLYAESAGAGGDSAAVYAINKNTNGIAMWGKASGADSTLVLEHKAGSGDFIRAFQTDPSNLRFRVDVNGNVSADGAFTPGGADLAEMWPAVEGLQPGDVLVIAADGKLARSSAPYASNIVGVYSSKPGFIGGAADGKELTGKVPLAVVGIVPVKVSAENGPIRPGDLLVSAATAGHAMKATEFKAGTILGKALGELRSGSGVIYALVTLQ